MDQNNFKYHRQMGSDIAIVGGGLAGLSCAIWLNQLGIDFTLYEASDTLGGRIASYKRKQLIVDKGFQVLLPHYNLTRQLLDYSSLNLCHYPRGATIITQDGPQWFGHQYPDQYKSGPKLTAKWSDYLQLGFDTFKGIQKPTRSSEICQDYFKNNYSEPFNRQFLTPFFRGVFLDPACLKSVSQFQYYLHCFFRKGAAIPEKGMVKIIEQLEAQIPSERIQKNSPITHIKNNQCIINDHPQTFKHIVIATDFSTCFKLLNIPEPAHGWHHVHNYILAKKNPTQLAPLILNAKKSPISHMNIPTLVSSQLAPEGTHYMNVSTFSKEPPKAIESEVHKITGEKDWNFVWEDTIQNALPSYRLTPTISNPNVTVIGDWTQFPSIEGAITSAHRFKSVAKKRIK